MRELIFKNLTKPTARKRDISMEEVVEKNGLVSTTKKRSMYFVRGVHHLKTKEKVEEWMSRRRKGNVSGKKFFHVLRKYSDSNKEDKLVCKMRGSFYIISEQDIYNIVFVHAIKIQIKKPE